MKCYNSISELYVILSEIPKMTEEDYNTCVAEHQNFDFEPMQVFFHIPVCTPYDAEVMFKVAEILESRWFILVGDGRLFFDYRSNSSYFCHSIGSLSVIHVFSESTMTKERRALISFATANGYLNMIKRSKESAASILEDIRRVMVKTDATVA